MIGHRPVSRRLNIRLDCKAFLGPGGSPEASRQASLRQPIHAYIRSAISHADLGLDSHPVVRSAR